MVKDNRSAYKIFSVGDKGSVALARPMPDLMDTAITHVQMPLNFPTGITLVIQLLLLLLVYWSMLKIVIELS